MSIIRRLARLFFPRRWEHLTRSERFILLAFKESKR